MTNIAPFNGQTYFIAESMQTGKTRVYFFTIKESIYKLFSQSSLIIIPESLLVLNYLRKLTGTTSVKINRNSNEILASLQKDGFISLTVKPNSENIEQVVRHALVNVEQSEVVKEGQYLSILFKQLASLPFYVYAQSFNYSIIKRKASELPLKLIGLTAATVVSCYLIFSSTWLYFKNESLTAELTLQRSALDEVFALQSAMDKESELLAQLANNEKISIVTADVWPILLALVNTDAEILSLNYFDHQYTVRVKSPRSTDVIQFLSDNQSITAPEVTSAAIKSRGKEIITVKFSLLAQSLEPVEVNNLLKSDKPTKGVMNEPA